MYNGDEVRAGMDREGSGSKGRQRADCKAIMVDDVVLASKLADSRVRRFSCSFSISRT